MATLEQNIKFIYKGVLFKHRHNGDSVCDEWLGEDGLKIFIQWMKDVGYENDNPDWQYYLQRKDISLPYSPDNCFLRRKGRRKNKEISAGYNSLNDEEKKRVIDTFLSGEKTTREIAREYGVCQGTINKILRNANIGIETRRGLSFVDKIEGEEWKDIKGLEGKYAVSNLGRVKTYNYKGMGIEHLIKPNIIDGYLSVCLGKPYKIHRLVAEAFIPNPNNYTIVNHKNERRDDPRAENLEWCSLEYNNTYSTGFSIIATNIDNGEQIRFPSVQSVKGKGFDPSLVCKCLKGGRKTHKGYTFEYENTQSNLFNRTKRRETSIHTTKKFERFKFEIKDGYVIIYSTVGDFSIRVEDAEKIHNEIAKIKTPV